MSLPNINIRGTVQRGVRTVGSFGDNPIRHAFSAQGRLLPDADGRMSSRVFTSRGGKFPRTGHPGIPEPRSTPGLHPVGHRDINALRKEQVHRQNMDEINRDPEIKGKAESSHRERINAKIEKDNGLKEQGRRPGPGDESSDVSSDQSLLQSTQPGTQDADQALGGTAVEAGDTAVQLGVSGIVEDDLL